MLRMLIAAAVLLISPLPVLTAQPSDSSTDRDALRLGLMRTVPEKWNLEGNFSIFLERLAEAHARGVQVFVTPECWLDGYAAADPTSTRERLRGIAQDIATSPYLEQVAEQARKRRMMICFGFTSLENNRIYNAAGLWDATGQLMGVYHKTHLQTHDLQFDYGDALVAWPTAWGPMGMIICADRRWPESVRTERLQGAGIILNPTYGYRGELNTAMMRTRAMENQCFIAFTHPEEGLVTGPGGRIVAQERDDAGVLVCDIDLAEAKMDGHLADRRPELYGSLAQGVTASATQARPDEPVLRVAAAQMLSSFNVSANTDRMLRMLEDAHTRGARVIVFPEMALTGYAKAAAFRDTLDWTAVEAGLSRL